MNKAEEYLNSLSDGYDGVERHQMITLPKIRLQHLMHSYAEQHFQDQLKEPLKKIQFLKEQRTTGRFRINDRHEDDDLSTLLNQIEKQLK